jgi:hypothetical protein
MNTAIKTSYPTLHSLYELYRQKRSCADMSLCVVVLGPKFVWQICQFAVELHFSGSAWHFGQFVENSTKLTSLEFTGYRIEHSSVLWLLELQIRRSRKV